VDPWAKVDLYCERTDWSFWSEPLNAVTNLAFLIAAILIVRRVRRERGALPWDASLLAALAVLVGVGSFLFHTFATVWGRWLDLAFIAIFIYVVIARFLARAAGLGWRGALVGLVLYFALERGARVAFPPETLSGSVVYLPALLTLTAFAAYAWQRRDPAAPRLVTAVAVFLVALVLRTVDHAVCQAWPAGTHFLWHLMVAWVLYLAATAVLAPRRAAGTSS
jgi:hypothetical protein